MGSVNIDRGFGVEVRKHALYNRRVIDVLCCFFFFSSRRRHTRFDCDWSSDVCSSDLGFIITVEGGTDSVGSAEYNYSLSERRADSVIQYLASKHNIPAHKIYLVGLGKDKPVEDNKSREGRAKNRRVDVRLMTNTAEGSTPAQQQAPATAPPPSE